MMMRFLIALVITLTILTLAMSPVAGMAGSERVACADLIVEAPTHHHVDHDAMVTPSGSENKASFVCCDHGCLFDLTVAGVPQRKTMTATSVPNNWNASGYSNLTEPLGLRRPPRV